MEKCEFGYWKKIVMSLRLNQFNKKIIVYVSVILLENVIINNIIYYYILLL